MLRSTAAPGVIGAEMEVAMRILLAIDSSPLADETVAMVRRTFRPGAASVVVLCVVGENEPQTIPSPVLLASVAQNLAVLEADLVRTHEEVAAHAAGALREAGLEAVSEVAYGDPRQAVVEAARSHHADLIVVGAHIHSLAHDLVIGSMASHVLTHAPCSVLFVRHGGR